MGWLGAFVNSSIGKKWSVAVTGGFLFLFVLGHMLGNLQIFAGPELFNHYAELLRIEPPLLWIIRLFLLTMVAIHVINTVRVTLENRAARRTGYAGLDTVVATYASRTMIWGGIALFAFVAYHLLHLTFGVGQGREFHGIYIDKHGRELHDVYANVIRGFQSPLVVGVYLVGQIALLGHLWHGFQSAFQTLGWNHPKYTPTIKTAGVVLALVIVAGYLSVPVSVLAGWIE